MAECPAVQGKACDERNGKAAYDSVEATGSAAGGGMLVFKFTSRGTCFASASWIATSKEKVRDPKGRRSGIVRGHTSKQARLMRRAALWYFATESAETSI